MPKATTTTLKAALLPSPALFDVTTIAAKNVDGAIERVALDQLELAPNARRDISQDGIERLAAMLCRTGQLVPCIGHRASPAAAIVLYDGQRRLLAARASHRLAGGEGFEGLEPVQSLIVLLLDHHPAPDEIRRIQAQVNNAREDLSLADQQEQLARLLGGPRRTPGGRPDRRRVRRPRHLAAQGPQPAPPAHPPGRDPRPRRRAPERRAAVGDDGKPPRRHAPGRTRAHRRGRQTDHLKRPARQGPARPRRVRAPHRDRGRAHLRGADRRRRHARRRRADRARPRPPHPRQPPATRRHPRRQPRQARRRARHAQRPRPSEGAQAPDHTRDPRPRPRRPLRVRARTRPGLRRRHLGRRPRVHRSTSPATRSTPAATSPPATRRSSPAPGSTTPSSATPPSRTAGESSRRAHAKPTRPAPTSASDTTSAPG